MRRRKPSPRVAIALGYQLHPPILYAMSRHLHLPCLLPPFFLFLPVFCVNRNRFSSASLEHLPPEHLPPTAMAEPPAKKQATEEKAAEAGPNPAGVSVRPPNPNALPLLLSRPAALACQWVSATRGLSQRVAALPTTTAARPSSPCALFVSDLLLPHTSPFPVISPRSATKPPSSAQ